MSYYTQGNTGKPNDCVKIAILNAGKVLSVPIHQKYLDSIKISNVGVHPACQSIHLTNLFDIVSFGDIDFSCKYKDNSNEYNKLKYWINRKSCIYIGISIPGYASHVFIVKNKRLINYNLLRSYKVFKNYSDFKRIVFPNLVYLFFAVLDKKV